VQNILNLTEKKMYALPQLKQEEHVSAKLKFYGGLGKNCQPAEPRQTYFTEESIREARKAEPGNWQQ
jgi:hypothetical protein